MPGAFSLREKGLFLGPGRQNCAPPRDIGAPSELNQDRLSRIKRRYGESWPSTFMRRGNSKGDEGSLFQCLLAMAAAATTAMVFSLISGINWQFGLVLMGTAAALAGAALFTFLEMRRLGRASLGRELTQATRQGASGGQNTSIESTYSVTRAEQRRRKMGQSVDSNEACFHHENHPESPGEDQGQLTSHLSGSTPFLENLDSEPQIRAEK